MGGPDWPTGGHVPTLLGKQELELSLFLEKSMICVPARLRMWGLPILPAKYSDASDRHPPSPRKKRNHRCASQLSTAHPVCHGNPLGTARGMTQQQASSLHLQRGHSPGRVARAWTPGGWSSPPQRSCLSLFPLSQLIPEPRAPIDMVSTSLQ